MAIPTNCNTAGTIYWDNSGTGTTAGGWNLTMDGSYFTTMGTTVTINTETNKKTRGLHSELVFKFIKKKMTILGRYRYEHRINKLKKLAEKYLTLGQDVLSRKFLDRIKEEVIFSEMVGAGIKMFVNKSLIDEYKHKVRGGHISDTLFEKYTNPIPDDILKRKKELDKLGVFDKYVVYHYWNEKLEEKKIKREKDKGVKIDKEEKQAMRDPILFGIRNDFPDKLFFIADWDDDYCDLSFDELIGALPVEDNDVTIGQPKIEV